MSDRAIIPTAQWQEPNPDGAASAVARYLFPVLSGGVWGFTTARPATAALVLSGGVVGIDPEVYPTMRLAGVGGRVVMINIPAYVP